MGHVHTRSPLSSGKKLIWAILFNSVITLAEFIGGIMTGYLSLLADAVHNLSDVAALALAWVGVKGSQLPATKRSTFGYKRIEVMTAFVSAAALIVIAVFILLEAYERLKNPQPITNPTLFLSVAVVGLIGNVLSIWLLHSEKGKSLNMKTAFLHMAYDAISSVAVIIGGIIIAVTGWVLIDTIMSAIIALMIFWSSYLVIKEAVLIFLEAVPPEIDFDKVAAAISDVERVRDVHDLHIWSLSSSEKALSCHVCVDADEVGNSPSIAASINRMIADRFRINHGTIQVEVEGCGENVLLCNSRLPEEKDGADKA
ncbi:MAG: cation diffusion facilitator family transporter [bacterium]|nr:cation diffusion facilitator family transporter [bacterium]